MSLRDPGFNVASWNPSNRDIRIQNDGEISVKGQALRFVHFTKLGEVGTAMTERYALDNTDVYELWAGYRDAVSSVEDPGLPAGYWHHGQYQGGQAIPRAARHLYCDRADVQKLFPEPFASGSGSYQEWFTSNGAAEAG